MCGIFCYISGGDVEDCHEKCLNAHRRKIQKRGPDYSDETQIATDSYKITFYACVLWTQGPKLTKQPLETNSSILLFNGDIYGGLEDDSILTELGDTFALLKVLETVGNSSKHSESHSPTVENSLQQLESLQGPFAFIYYDKIGEELYFARDKYGRVSLLMGSSHEGLIISSVATQTEGSYFTDVPPVGVFCLSLRTDSLRLRPYVLSQDLAKRLEGLEKVLRRNIIVEYEYDVHGSLIGVRDEGFVSEPDGLERFKPEEVFERLLSKPEWFNRVDRLKTLLSESVRKRTTNHPNLCKSCTEPCNHPTIGILFSGGLDCTILTILTDRFLPESQPVELINVSFTDKISPDRLTGRGSLEEIKRLCPGREWRFVEADVTREELEEGREGEVIDSVYPLDTVLDDSLGCAMWFASRGRSGGYEASCRILLVGTGADELFGGYTKHRAAFRRASWSGLQESLDCDWRDLPHRNLGRDNRVICDHGRQMRTPYLDEGVVEYVRSLPCWEKMFLSDNFPKGVGDKLLLRLLAYDLGLKGASKLPKRALQFGSRIANKNENAHEICPRLIRNRNCKRN